MNNKASIDVLCLTSIILFFCLFYGSTSRAAQLKAGVAKVNITNTESVDIIHDSLFVKVLVMESGKTSMVIFSVDAIAMGA